MRGIELAERSAEVRRVWVLLVSGLDEVEELPPEGREEVFIRGVGVEVDIVAAAACGAGFSSSGAGP
jgi:hypothetical protein